MYVHLVDPGKRPYRCHDHPIFNLQLAAQPEHVALVASETYLNSSSKSALGKATSLDGLFLTAQLGR